MADSEKIVSTSKPSSASAAPLAELRNAIFEARRRVHDAELSSRSAQSLVHSQHEFVADLCGQLTLLEYEAAKRQARTRP